MANTNINNSFSLTAASAFFASLLLTLFLPVQFYVANSEDLSFPVADHIPLFVGCGTGLFVSLMLLHLVLLSHRARYLYSLLLAVIALFLWLQSFLMIPNVGLLDGTGLDLSFSMVNLTIEFLILIFIATTIGWLAHLGRLNTIVTFMTSIAIVNFCIVLVSLNTDKKIDHQSGNSQSTIEQFASYSSSKNITVFIMDGLQSDVFEQVLDTDPRLKQQFDGFTYYPDTLGVAATTRFSIPAIHSGETFQGTGNIGDYLQESVEANSIINLAAKSRFSTRDLNPFAGRCARRLEVCLDSTELLGTERFVSRHEALLLLDLSLLRTAPSFGRRYVYSEGDWLFLGIFGWIYDVSFQARNVLSSYLVMEQLLDTTSFENSRPVFSFIRNLTTHDPFVMNPECRYESRERTRAAVLDQSRCILNLLGNFIKLHRSNVSWDRSMFIVVADHGLHPDSRGKRPVDNAGQVSPRIPGSGFEDPHMQGLVANANPTLAIHYPGQSGELKKSMFPAQLTDLAATICQILDNCAGMPGTNLSGRAFDPEGNYPDRYFMNRVSDTNIEHYKVTGPVWEKNSWTRFEP